MSMDLFPETQAPTPAGRRAPAELNPAQTRSLEIWAEDYVPWIARGALDSLTPLDEYADSCLNYFAGKKTMRPNWLGTVKNWIRRDERTRLEKMVRIGNESARLALRDRKRWRDSFDRTDRHVKLIAATETPLVSPKQNQEIRSVTLGRRA